jgi:hypothetical protein
MAEYPSSSEHIPIHSSESWLAFAASYSFIHSIRFHQAIRSRLHQALTVAHIEHFIHSGMSAYHGRVSQLFGAYPYSLFWVSACF